MSKEFNVEITHVSQAKPAYQFIDEDTVEYWANRIDELAKKGAKVAYCGKMCGDCAFKVNQPHTVDYLESVDGAVLMLTTEGRFNCHTKEHKDAGRSCVGFEYAKAYLNSIE